MTLLRRVGDAVILTDQFEQAFQSLGQKLKIKIFGPAAEEEFHPDAMTLTEKFAGPGRLDGEIVVAGADFNLNALHLAAVGLALDAAFFLLLVFQVLELAKVHNLGDRRIGRRRNLNQIRARVKRSAQGLAQFQDAQIGARLVNHPQLGGFYLMIDPRFQSQRRPA